MSWRARARVSSTRCVQRHRRKAEGAQRKYGGCKTIPRMRPERRQRVAGARATLAAVPPETAAVGLAAAALVALKNLRVPAEKTAPSFRELKDFKKTSLAKLLAAKPKRRSIDTEAAIIPADASHACADKLAPASSASASTVQVRQRQRVSIRGVRTWRETIAAMRAARTIDATDKYVTSSSTSSSSSWEEKPWWLLSRIPKVFLDQLRYESSGEATLGSDESLLPDVPALYYGDAVPHDAPVLSLAWRRAVAKACDAAVGGFGVSVLAIPDYGWRKNGDIDRKRSSYKDTEATIPGGGLGVATLRVKRLPPREVRAVLDAAVERYGTDMQTRAKDDDVCDEEIEENEQQKERDMSLASMSLVVADDDYEVESMSMESLRWIASDAPRNSTFVNAGYLSWLGVDRELRGTGVGRRLLQWTERKAASWGLSVLCLHCHRRNTNALTFYSRCGYDVSPDWLGWRSDEWLLLTKKLSARSRINADLEPVGEYSPQLIPVPIRSKR